MARTTEFPHEPIPHDFLSWNFAEIRKHLSEGRKCFNEECPKGHQWSATQKIAYFREAVIQAKLAGSEFESSRMLTDFLDLCDLEIERLKPEAEREAADRERREQSFANFRKNRRSLDYSPVSLSREYQPITYGAEPAAKGKAKKNEGELTVEQAAIFFHYFFELANVRSDLQAAKKIDVIRAVTRWSRNSIANIIYDKKGGGIFRKANGEDYTTFEADMQAVRSLYKKMGLQNVVEMIDEEIEDVSGNL